MSLSNPVPVNPGPATAVSPNNVWDAFIGTPNSGPSVSVSRTSTYTGGTPGNVNSCLQVASTPSAGNTNFEWSLVSIMNNSATAGSNVAIYGQGNKLTGAGPTWAGVFESRDKSGNASPTSGQIGIEVDVFADGADASSNRVGIDVVGGVGVSIGPTITYGIRVGPQSGNASNCTFLNGIYLYGTMTVGITIASSTGSVGIDTSSATLSAAAYRLANTQFIGFDATDTHRLGMNAGNLSFSVSGTVQAAFGGAGSVILNGGVTVISGGFNTGSVTPVLTGNKPGSTASIGTWLSVTVNSTQFWIPAWAN